MSTPDRSLGDEQPSLNDDGTLYDPPSTPEDASPPEEDTVGLRISLSEHKADRLQAVAEQLGLPPATLAERAIEMICGEVVTIQEDSRSPDLLVEQYQARIDLLHAVEGGSPSTPPSPSTGTGSGTTKDGSAGPGPSSSGTEEITGD